MKRGGHGDLCYNLDDKGFLIDLVEIHMIPELKKNHKIKYTTIATSHNPIRLTEIDGKNIDWNDPWKDYPLIPDYITIPEKEVVRLMRKNQE